MSLDNNSYTQAQGQVIQWPKEKGQSLIYKTFPPQPYIFSQEAKIRFLFFGHKKKSAISLQMVIINFSLRTVGPNTCTIFYQVQFSLKTRVQFYVIRQ
jgi:hypothetical protein